MEFTTAFDNKGVPRTYYFNRPTDVLVYVKIDIVRDLNLWVQGYGSVVKTNCIKVIGGVNTIASTSTYKGRGTGADVFAWKLIAAQSAFQEFDSVKVGQTSPATQDVLPINSRQRAKLITVNIQVNFI